MTAQVHIRDVVAQTQVLDGDSLLTPAVLARIVTAVLAAQRAQQQDEEARRRDTQVGGGDCGCHGRAGGRP